MEQPLVHTVHPARLLSAMMVLVGFCLLAYVGAKQSGVLQAVMLTAVGATILVAPFSSIIGAFALVARKHWLAELFSQYYLLFRELTKFILPNDFGFTGIAVTNLAVLAVSEGRFLDAKELLTEQCTLKIDQPLKISLLGQISAFTGDTADALERLAEARRLVLDASSDNPDTTQMQALAELYSNECGLLPDVGKTDEAIASGRRGLELRERICGNDSYEVAKTLNNLGYAYLKAKRFAEARETLERAYELARKLSKDTDYAGGNITNNLGCALMETGDTDRAFELLKAATVLPADGPFEHGYREYTLGDCYARAGDHQNAARRFCKAFRHWSHVQGLLHPDYKNCVSLYANTLQKLGKTREYEKVKDLEAKLSAGLPVPPKAMPLIR